MEVDLIAPISKSPLDGMRGRGGKHVFRVRFSPKSRVVKPNIVEQETKTTIKIEIGTPNRVDTCLMKQ